MNKICNDCAGEMVAMNIFNDNEEQTSFMKCKVCGNIDEESFVYG